MRKFSLLVVLLLAILGLSGCKSKNLDSVAVLEKHEEGEIYTFTCGEEVYELSIKENGDCSLMHMVTEKFENITVNDILVSETPYSSTTIEYSEGTLVYEEDDITFSCVFDKQYVGMEYSEEVTDEIKKQMVKAARKSNFLTAGDMEAMLNGEYVEWKYSFNLGERTIHGQKLETGVQLTKIEEISEYTNSETGKKEEFVSMSVEWKEDSIIHIEAGELEPEGTWQDTTIYNYEGIKISLEEHVTSEQSGYTRQTEYYPNGNPKYWCEWGYDREFDKRKGMWVDVGECYKRLECEYYENVEEYEYDMEYDLGRPVIGTKKIVTYLSNDVIEVIEEYHENGEIAKIVEYKNGVPSDSREWYLDSGALRKTVKYYENGVPKLEKEYYENGYVSKTWVYDEQGNIKTFTHEGTDGQIITELLYNSKGVIISGYETEILEGGVKRRYTYQEGYRYKMEEFTNEGRKTVYYNLDGSIKEEYVYDENGNFISQM